MTFTLQAPASRPPGPRGEAIASLGPWFHNIHLPTGEQTAPGHPLGDFPNFTWEQIRSCVPEDLHGATALDIGCNAGFYSLELARRGARVIGIEPDERYLAQARWAAGELGLAERIEYRALSVYDLIRSQAGMPERFDVVVFMGVLYHLRYPMLGLDLASSRVGGERGRLVFQTLTMPTLGQTEVPRDLPITERRRLAEPGWPKMAFIEQRLASDQTNWWAPDAVCCEAMLRAAGLRVVARPGDEIYVCERAREEPLEAGERAANLMALRGG